MKILYISLAALVNIPMFIIGVCLYVREKDIRENCTVETEGTILKYSANNPVGFPIVTYTVNNETYKGKLKYTYTVTTSSPITKTEIIDYEAPVLKIRRNSIASIVTLKDYFPIGSTLPVFYNKENPKRNIVLRYSKNYMPYLLMISSIIIGPLLVVVGLVFL